MKRLHLIRHAKSSWSSGAIADIERPLNKRGLKSCALMAEQMVKAGCPFEPIFCSPAVRAQSTIENIAYKIEALSASSKALQEKLGRSEVTWQTDPALYTFEMQDLLAWCQQLNNSFSEAVVVGHNSALTDFVNTVSDQHLDNLPTCGYVQLLLNIEKWQDLSSGTGEVLSLLTPKMFNAVSD
ncbi:MAG: histidine phosphatase family protein [Cyanobacteria bacterium P01_D01_bin.36]